MIEWFLRLVTVWVGLEDSGLTGRLVRLWLWLMLDWAVSGAS